MCSVLKLTLAHILHLFHIEADLRIGELRWGDSGVYYCKVVIADDLEGQNEAHVELLVLGEPPYTYNRTLYSGLIQWLIVMSSFSTTVLSTVAHIL